MDKMHIEKIVPRASRKERVSLHRKKNPSLEQSLSSSRKRSRYFYFFYLALLACGFLSMQFYKKNPNFSPSSFKQKKIIISPFRTVLLTLVQNYSRSGISLLIRNNTKSDWHIDSLIFSFPGGSTSKDDIYVKADSFHVLFLETPLSFKRIHQGSLSIKTKETL